MKKLLCLTLVLLMIASVALVACDKPDDPNYNDTDDLAFNPTQSTEETTTEAPVTTEPPVYQFTEVNEQVYVKNCLEVNLRSTPSSASKDNLEGSLTFGDEKTYKRVLYNEVWSGLEIDGEILYVNTEYLTTDDGFVVFDDIDKTIYAVNTVSSSGVFVYSYTDTEEEARCSVVKHGAALQATGLSKNGKWYRINFTYTDENGKQVTLENLYIYNGKYVSDTQPTETAPAAE